MSNLTKLISEFRQKLNDVGVSWSNGRILIESSPQDSDLYDLVINRMGALLAATEQLHEEVKKNSKMVEVRDGHCGDAFHALWYAGHEFSERCPSCGSSGMPIAHYKKVPNAAYQKLEAIEQLVREENKRESV